MRFVVGCALVVALLAAIVVSVALLIGWRLARDETPDRTFETFLVGDETRYWCFDLKPDDAGLQAFFKRLDEINDTTRRNILRGTVLETIPFPQRRARLNELAPITLEFSLPAGGEVLGWPLPDGWAARGTFSHGLFRMRAALKAMRFVAGRDPTKSESFDVDGISVTEIHDKNARFAVATVGNRVVLTSDVARMRTLLSSPDPPSGSRLAERFALHKAIAIDGEDAWAFVSATRLGDLSNPIAIDGAVASFDLNARDELAFRVIVQSGGTVEDQSAFGGTVPECSTVVSQFLPGIPADALEIDGNGARPGGSGALEFSGRITGLSKRMAELLGRVTELRKRERPFAIPNPPSPPRPDDPRSETPGVPTHEGTPTPGR